MPLQPAGLMTDADLVVSRTLPPSTSLVTSTAFDTTKSTLGEFRADTEFLLEAPAVTNGELPNTKTFTYDVIHSTASDLSGSSVLLQDVIVQTGNGAGAAAASYRCKLPHDVRRYVGITITPSASGTGDASAKTATFKPTF